VGLPKLNNKVIVTRRTGMTVAEFKTPWGRFRVGAALQLQTGRVLRTRTHRYAGCRKRLTADWEGGEQ